MPFEVLESSAQAICAVLELAEARVARVAEKRPDLAGVVAVVDGHATDTLDLRAAADRADTALLREHRVILLQGEPVLPHQVAARAVERHQLLGLGSLRVRATAVLTLVVATISIPLAADEALQLLLALAGAAPLGGDVSHGRSPPWG